jgi:hypothetical protein
MEHSEEYYKMKYFKYKAKYEQAKIQQSGGGASQPPVAGAWNKITSNLGFGTKDELTDDIKSRQKKIISDLWNIYQYVIENSTTSIPETEKQTIKAYTNITDLEILRDMFGQIDNIKLKDKDIIIEAMKYFKNALMNELQQICIQKGSTNLIDTCKPKNIFPKTTN